MSESRNARIVIMASGEGTTAEAYAHALHSYKDLYPHEIAAVITNKEDAGILHRVERWNREWGFNVAVHVVNNHTHSGGPQGRGQTFEAAKKVSELVREYDADLILTLGFMTIVRNPLINDFGFTPGRHTSMFQARMLNWHPGPLPLTADTMGIGASEVVVDSYRRGKVDHSESSVHVVAPKVDGGPVFAADYVEIYPRDDAAQLFERVKRTEQRNIAANVEKFLGTQRVYNAAQLDGSKH